MESISVLLSYDGYLDRRIMIHLYEEFEKLIQEYEIERKDICLVGSSVLTEEGFRENRDVDLAVTEEARAKLLSVYRDKLNVLPSGTICFNENIQIGRNRYIELGIDNNLLFDDEYSRPYNGGFRIAKIEVEIAKKIKRFTTKDEMDLKVISTSEKLESIDWKQVLVLVCDRRKPNNIGSFCRQIKRKLQDNLRCCKGRCVNIFKDKEKQKYIENQELGVFCAILWGTVEPYFDAIETKIANYHKVIKSFTMNNVSNMEQFIDDIYSIDGVEKWKIKLKQAYLSEVVPTIRVILYEVDTPNFRISNRNGELLSDKGAKMKTKIRNKYKRRLDRYIYDVIIHTGDNYDISKKMLEVINNYGGLRDV